MLYDQIEIRRGLDKKFRVSYLTDGVDRVRGKAVALVWGDRNHLIYPRFWGKARGLRYLKKQIFLHIKKQTNYLKKLSKQISNVS